MAKGRQNINIELAGGSKHKVEQVRAKNGMTQKELISRLITWFCGQEPIVQQIVLGQIPKEYAPDVARLVLEKLANRDNDSPSPDGPEQVTLMGEIKSQTDAVASGHHG